MRFGLLAVTPMLGGALRPWVVPLARLLRFPVLVQASITCSVWWVILVPTIWFMLPTKHRGGFVRFNSSFFLVNVHLLNFVLAAGADFYLAPEPFVPFDLLCGFVAAYAYGLFYLFVLDPRGIQLYIVFTPRVHACGFAYGALVALYFGFYAAWNRVAMGTADGSRPPNF